MAKGMSWVVLILGILVAIAPWLFGTATNVVETVLGIIGIIVGIVMMTGK